MFCAHYQYNGYFEEPLNATYGTTDSHDQFNNSLHGFIIKRMFSPRPPSNRTRRSGVVHLGRLWSRFTLGQTLAHFQARRALGRHRLVVVLLGAQRLFDVTNLSGDKGEETND